MKPQTKASFIHTDRRVDSQAPWGLRILVGNLFLREATHPLSEGGREDRPVFSQPPFLRMSIIPQSVKAG